MKQLMRYTITSGRMVEVREVLMTVRTDRDGGRPAPRGKRRGKTLAAQLERNCREAIRSLARLIACNFGSGDLVVTLKYNNDRLPATAEEAAHQARLFLRRVGRAYQRRTGERMPWVLVTADCSSKTGDPVRLHHHLVLPNDALDLVWEHWPDDQINVRHMDGGGDYMGLARYLVRNTGYKRGCRSWSTSQGLRKPVFSAPEPVRTVGGARIPKEAHVVEREEHADPADGFRAGYLRYILPKGHPAAAAPSPGRAGGRTRALKTEEGGPAHA